LLGKIEPVNDSEKVASGKEDPPFKIESWRGGFAKDTVNS